MTVALAVIMAFACVANLVAGMAFATLIQKDVGIQTTNFRIMVAAIAVLRIVVYVMLEQYAGIISVKQV